MTFWYRSGSIYAAQFLHGAAFVLLKCIAIKWVLIRVDDFTGCKMHDAGQ